MGLKKMFDFNGRSSRKEFWIFYLINMAIIMFLSIITIGFTFSASKTSDVIYAQIILIISLTYLVLISVPFIAFLTRRLHDAGFSAWWLLIYFIPNIGFVTLLILAMFPSKPGHNKYGPNPYGKN